MRAKHLIVLLIFLVSCAPQISETPYSDNTVVPSATVELVDTPTLLPTATQSEVDKIFVMPTRNSSFVFGTTPTPIATPNNNLSIQLRDLSEDEYLKWIKELQGYSYQNYPPHDDWWSDGMFEASQTPVALAIQEYLYRFPDSPNAERLRWQLAFIDSITHVGGNAYDDNWIIAQLETRLNKGEASPENLESVLDQYWLDVDYYQSISNLFGNGETSWFYVVIPQVWDDEENNDKSFPDYFGRGGLFIVVREVGNGEFQLILLENALSLTFGESSLYKISDFNQNGVTEIALYIGFHSGTMCNGNLRIFEWKDNSFSDLTKDEIKIGDCVDNYEYSLKDGVPSIVLKRLFQSSPSIYTWNGTYYEFSSYRYSNLFEKWQSTRSPSEEAEVITEILASADLEGLNSARIDFLRYRLGILYALDSKVLQAKKVLHDLAVNPSDKTVTIYSEFSKNFLKYYTGNQSLYLACKESREILDNAMNSLTPEEEEEKFGNPNDFIFGLGLLRCFTRDVFSLLINNMSIETQDVASELQKNGINLFYAEKQDVNLDGSSEEWLIIHEDGIYVVSPNKTHYDAIEVDYFWYGEDATRYSGSELKIGHWNGIQDSVLAISADQELLILDIAKDFGSTRLGSEYNIKNTIFSPHSNPAQYQVEYIKPNPESFYPDNPWKGYRWDSAHQEFKDDLFEYIIFGEKDIEKAVEIADKLLPMLDTWKDVVDQWSDLPRYYYLCALSYELAGDSQEAAEIYWQLWRDFPESHYALLARYKLEPVSP